MEGTVRKVDINLEAMRQIAGIDGTPVQEQAKTASAAPSMIPTEYVEKLASALDYIVSDVLKVAAEDSSGVGPGQGAGQVMQVLESNRTEENLDVSDLGRATSKNQGPVNPGLVSGGVQSGDPGNALPTNDGMMHGEQPAEPIANEKASIEAQKQASVYLRNLQRLGLVKHAQDPQELPDSQELEAARDAALQELLQANAGGIKGFNRGALGGALAGTLGGAALGHYRRGPGALLGAAGGAMLGTGIGAVGGNMIGRRYDDPAAAEASAVRYEAAERALEDALVPKTATALYGRNLARLGLRKVAADDTNPAQLSSGQASSQGAEAPSGASSSEEATPPEPSDVVNQKNLISSNEAAINYTKGQAKADPKQDLRDVVTEPALSASTDPVLERAFDSTSEAGPKVASDMTRVAAARALLQKLAEGCGSAPAKAKKVKTSQLDTPQGQSGFNSASLGGKL